MILNLYNMIELRRSIRDFQNRQVEETIWEGFRKYQRELFALYPEIPYKIEVTCVLGGKKAGSLFSVKAPYYISLLTTEDRESYLNAGYIMEELSLYLAARGIGTCYQGMLKVKKEQENLSEVLVMAAGYPKKYLYRSQENRNRLPLSKVCVFKEEPSKEIMAILKAAAMAPSSFNSQPWRFIVYKNRIHIFMQKVNNGIFKRNKLHLLDIGMALNHIMITAEELWVEAELKEIDNLSSHSIRNYEYITSFILKTE